MDNMQSVNQDIKNVIKMMKESKEFLVKEEVELRKYYSLNYQNWIFSDSNGNEKRLDAGGFEEAQKDCLNYLDRNITFAEKVNSIEFISETKLSKQLSKIVSEYGSVLVNNFYEGIQFNHNLIFELLSKLDFCKEYNSITILSEFCDIKENIALIGSNGSGKTSLVNELKGNDQSLISVIPAQKSLYFSLSDTSLLSTRLVDLQELLLENNIRRSKSSNNYDYFAYQNNQFTKLLIAMKEQYFSYLIECKNENKLADDTGSILGKIKQMFSIIFSDIEVIENSSESEFLSFKKNNNKYQINGLSEGEKAFIYYASSVLMTKENAIIVVDEPETYLNTSLSNTVWDLLMNERRDCTFVFVTHSVDFVLARDNTKIVWMKEFEYPNTWIFERIDDQFGLPKRLLTEVLGSKKPIIFCEGDKSSLDYSIYRSLFEKKYTVIPIGGHMDVIKYCKVLNASEWIGIECKGIIDGDNYSQQTIDDYKQEGIFILPFNEIEMFLLSDEIVEDTINNIYGDKAVERIQNYKNQFWKTIEQRKEKIILDKIKKDTEFYIRHFVVENFQSVDSIEENLKKVSEYEVSKEYEEVKGKIEEVINTKDYREMLIYCSLKTEVSIGIANSFLDKDYVNKASIRLMSNDSLKEQIKIKYLPLL